MDSIKIISLAAGKAHVRKITEHTPETITMNNIRVDVGNTFVSADGRLVTLHECCYTLDGNLSPGEVREVLVYIGSASELHGNIELGEMVIKSTLDNICAVSFGLRSATKSKSIAINGHQGRIEKSEDGNCTVVFDAVRISDIRSISGSDIWDISNDA